MSIDTKKYSFETQINNITQISSDCYIAEYINIDVAKAVKPGMFFNILIPNKTFRRPFAFFDVCKKSGVIKFLFRVVGESTEYLSKLKKGDIINVLAPLGNSFILDSDKSKPVILIAGGVGIAPIHYLYKDIKNIRENVFTIFGASSKANLYINDDINKIENIYFATDDGSFGFKGNTLQLLKELLKQTIKEKPIIYACGPLPMFRGLKMFMNENKIDGYFSYETVMACAIGVCQGCAMKTDDMNVDVNNINKKNEKYVLCCKDGAIFEYNKIEI